MYSGNHGIAQNLFTVLNCAKRTLAEKNILYVFAGDGVEKPLLVAEKEKQKLENVIFLKSFEKKDMPVVLAAADAAVIPLKNIKLFEKALPSKMFEIMSMALPIILGVKGEAEELIKDAECGIIITPEDENTMEKAVLELYNSKELRERLGNKGREYVNLHFSRESIINRFERLL